MLEAKTIHIDLHLPKSWNQCTTDELEIIAAAIIAEQQRVGRYHPFDWSRVKLDVVLAVNNLHVVRNGRNIEDSESRNIEEENAADGVWIVSRSKEEGDFPISTGQLLALTEMLSWLDDKKSDKTIFMFPYPEITIETKEQNERKNGGSKFFTLHSSLFTLQGPPPLLDSYTWREYRWLTDWMQEYMRIGNAIAQGKSETRKVNNLLPQQERARNEFLAVLFKPADGGTVPSDSFAGFSPVRWQVILFWWSSLMVQLAKKFPKVFKSQPVGKKQRRPQKDTPWDFYNRVTATIQKYIGGLSAQAVDEQPYGVTLQQLEMMADEAAEMEKLKHKK